jgi:hypothetical protein
VGRSLELDLASVPLHIYSPSRFLAVGLII